MSASSPARRTLITLAVAVAASLPVGSYFLQGGAGTAGLPQTGLLRGAGSAGNHGTKAIRLTAAECVPSSQGQCIPSQAPSSYALDPTAANQIEEPATDAWAAYLCGAGASAVALAYWNIDVLHYPKLTATDPGGTFTYDPNGTNSATDGHGRSYIMYLATKIQPTNPPDPANWTGQGEVTLDPANRQTRVPTPNPCATP